MVAIPRLALGVRIEEVNAAIEGAVRRLGYNVTTMEQKDAVTAFISRSEVSSPSPRVAITRCAMCAYLYHDTCLYTYLRMC